MRMSSSLRSSITDTCKLTCARRLRQPMTSASRSINTKTPIRINNILRHSQNSSNQLNKTTPSATHTRLSTMPESRSKHPLVWIDCEMTGLDTSKDTIMSLACFVTDYELNMLDDGYEAVVHHSKEQLDQMGEWCTSHHRDSGLTQACLDSTTTAEQAADESTRTRDSCVKSLGGRSCHTCTTASWM
jgi:hypothetical protein